MPKFYTGMGDNGYTFIGKEKLGKGNIIFAAIGDIDELSTVIGIAYASLNDEDIKKLLRQIQANLSSISAELASSYDSAFRPKNPVSYANVKELEHAIKRYGKEISNISNFVLPGGTISSAYIQNARAVSRRAERSVILASNSAKVSSSILSYLNRLSSLLFVIALYINKKAGINEEFS